MQSLASCKLVWRCLAAARAGQGAAVAQGHLLLAHAGEAVLPSFSSPRARGGWGDAPWLVRADVDKQAHGDRHLGLVLIVHPLPLHPCIAQQIAPEIAFEAVAQPGVGRPGAQPVCCTGFQFLVAGGDGRAGLGRCSAQGRWLPTVWRQGGGGGSAGVGSAGAAGRGGRHLAEPWVDVARGGGGASGVGAVVLGCLCRCRQGGGVGGRAGWRLGGWGAGGWPGWWCHQGAGQHHPPHFGWGGSFSARVCASGNGRALPLGWGLPLVECRFVHQPQGFQAGLAARQPLQHQQVQDGRHQVSHSRGRMGRVTKANSVPGRRGHVRAVSQGRAGVSQGSGPCGRGGGGRARAVCGGGRPAPVSWSAGCRMRQSRQATSAAGQHAAVAADPGGEAGCGCPAAGARRPACGCASFRRLAAIGAAKAHGQPLVVSGHARLFGRLPRSTD